MTDEPIEPGRGLPVYQPATATEDGTCIAPPDARPSVIRLVCTPISGMVSETGLATGAGPAAKAIAAGLRSGILRPRRSADDAGSYGAGGNRRPGRPGRRPR